MKQEYVNPPVMLNAALSARLKNSELANSKSRELSKAKLVPECPVPAPTVLLSVKSFPVCSSMAFPLASSINQRATMLAFCGSVFVAGKVLILSLLGKEAPC